MPSQDDWLLNGHHTAYALGGFLGVLIVSLLLCLNFKRLGKRQRVALEVHAAESNSMPISHGGTSVSTRSSHALAGDDPTLDAAKVEEGEDLPIDDGESSAATSPVTVKNNIIGGADGGLLVTEDPSSPYAQLSGIKLDIQVENIENEDDVDGTAVRIGSRRGSFNKSSLRSSKKKDKRNSVQSSGTLNLGDDKGDYASVSSVLTSDVASDYIVEGDNHSLRSRGSIKSRRNSLRATRKPSSSLPCAPQSPLSPIPTCKPTSLSSGVATASGTSLTAPGAPPGAPSGGGASANNQSTYACVSPVLTRTTSPEVDMNDDASVQSPCSVRDSTSSRASRRDRIASLPLISADYASVTIVRNGSPVAAGVDGIDVQETEPAEGHYAAVLRVNSDNEEDMGNAIMELNRLQKSCSVGGDYAQVDLNAVMRSRDKSLGDDADVKELTGGKTDAHERIKRLQTLPVDQLSKDVPYARPKKLSIDHGDSSTMSTYAQPIKKQSLTNTSEPTSSSAPTTHEDAYAMLSPCESRKAVPEENPYAHPALPERTADALSLLSSDLVLSSDEPLMEVPS
eukprot:scpid44135/ scgid13557/ 